MKKVSILFSWIVPGTRQPRLLHLPHLPSFNFLVRGCRSEPHRTAPLP